MTSNLSSFFNPQPERSSRLLRTSHLRIDGISLTLGNRKVLTDISLTVSSGQRIGLIGENGSGKSTLLKVAAGLLTPDQGTVRHETQFGTAVGLFHQTPPFAPDATVAQAIESAIKRVRMVTDRVDSLAQEIAKAPSDTNVVERYAVALTEAERLNAWDIDYTIATTLSGLGLEDITEDRRCDELSGGQLARLSLAWLLLHEPEILLLDEPTNHLDDYAKEYLERTLSTWRGPVLVASHDRSFLDSTITGVADLDPSPIPAQENHSADHVQEDSSGISEFTGKYSDYLAARALARIQWQRQYRDEQAELERLHRVIQDSQQIGHLDWKPRTEGGAAKKFHADRNAAVVSRRVKNSTARFETLKSNQIAKPPTEPRFSAMAVARHDSQLEKSRQGLAVSNLELESRLEPVSFKLAPDEKLLVTGVNGTGKSTLLRLIAGELTPTGGSIRRSPDARIGLLHQENRIPKLLSNTPNAEVTNSPEGSPTAAEAFTSAVGADCAMRNTIGSFGLLRESDEDLPVDALSVGQLKRLELAIVLAQSPDILLLDEPTNHLALSLVSVLEEQIPDYPGIVIIASHDRWLRDRWTGLHIQL